MWRRERACTLVAELWGFALRGAALSAVLASLPGCGDPKHAPFLEDREAHTSTPAKDAGPHTPPRKDAGETGSNEPAAPNESPNDGPDPVAGANIFESNQVYIFGTLVEGTTGWEAIAAVDKPDDYVVGFLHGTLGGRAQVRDGMLLYTMLYVPGIYTFVPEGKKQSSPADEIDYPATPEANDPITDTPPCEQGTDGDRPFRTSPEGRLIYQCRDNIWYEGGKEFFVPLETETLLSVGFDGLVLVRPMAIVTAGGRNPISELDGIGGFRTARALKDGFQVVMDSAPESGEPALWQITASGKATRVGVYPAVLDFSENESELLADDVLVQAGLDPDGNDTIVRRPIKGEAETLYSEATNPLVKMFHSPDLRLIPHDSSIFVVR